MSAFLQDRQHEPLLAVDEIQGNVLPGFNKPFQIFVFLQSSLSSAAREWLYVIAKHITSLREVLDYRKLRHQSGGAPDAFWMNVAFSFPALRRLAPDADLIVDQAFKEGLAARLNALEAAGTLSDWVVGANAGTPDVMLILGHDRPDELQDVFDKLVASLPSDVSVLHIDRAARLPGSIEHFGYRDGIAQPGIRGRVSSGSEFLTASADPADPNHGKRGQPLLWPGEFVFGYPEEHASVPFQSAPPAIAGPIWMRNGSFATYAHIRQHVGVFRQCCETLSQQARSVEPKLGWLSPLAVGARLIGRWSSGAPVILAPNRDDPALGADDLRNDAFVFGPGVGPGPKLTADAQGLRCPFNAHIRKMQPRNIPGQNSHRHRLIRRGIPFGPLYPHLGDRGLLFLSYQASIERQFEFVLRHWGLSRTAPNSDSGVDPLLAAAFGGPKALQLQISVEGRPLKFDAPLEKPMIEMMGGEHFFSPSIATVRMLTG